ncbi:FAD-binding oxidoreductase [Chengkuizengella marina]|uniref:D-lactate dehydrogenase (cytochrome) n=1 Tax=Chengkuizengella marina TaxID=2507566 RepID=A0A6N9Q4L8_9BACL|nr:FAD-linked oxidase C-terminal domain-containing protein [Chengkuizengella marina]NBI29789.1 FAD-binding protein [Chengkuizengella marina]
MNLYQDLYQFFKNENHVSQKLNILLDHSKDQSSYHPSHLPEVVVFPENKVDVIKILKYANENKIPVVPFGLGTSVEGQVIPIEGGISMNMTRMNKITELQPDNFLVKVEPGVTRVQLNDSLKEHLLHFPIDPAIDASIGGMVSTNASGTNSVRYGSMKDQVLGMQIILANGEELNVGGQYLKSSSGYNLTNLFVGSEATLGVFTEITLRVYNIPKYKLTALVEFTDLISASNAVVNMKKRDLSIERVELIDERTIEAINRYKSRNFSIAPYLFLELGGNEDIVHHDYELAKEILIEEGCLNIQLATNDLERENLWEIRHEVAFAIKSLNPEKKLMTTDVCVPLTVLPNAIKETRKIMDHSNIECAILGHVGDGNFHAVFSVDPENKSEVGLYKKINEQIVDYALKNGGTCSGEHGIGLGKIEYMYKQHGNSVSYMRQIKSLFDPNNIMNPSKIFKK